jgi:1,4-alpha-glucan branching enzyme
MFKKQYVKSRKVYKVTFEMPPAHLPVDVKVKSLALAGDFNNWNETDTPLKKLKSGTYKVTVEFDPGQSVQFRYLLNGETWLNDWEADDYWPNQAGEDNSVIDLPPV